MTDHGYVAYTHGCRCEMCRAAKAEYQRARRARVRAIAGRLTERRTNRFTSIVGLSRHFVPDVKHGSPASYVESGCRCWDCTTAVSRKRRLEADRAKARKAAS